MPPVLSFTVERSEPELIAPAEPTPYEFKMVSDIDDQRGLRFQTKGIHFYRNNTTEIQGKDPVMVIKEAIAKTLVYYYPFAGRLREGPDDKLMVECTGEGVIFVEANANVRLEQFGVPLRPPFPGAEELIADVPGSAGILHCPLLLIQVTRLKCGGFVFSLRLNHVMADAPGVVQFMTAVGEIARGESVPAVQPVWRRELLNARHPPQVSFVHHVYTELNDHDNHTPVDDLSQLVQQTFFFGRNDIATLRNCMPPELYTCSEFDLLSACFWRCRTRALNYNLSDQVRVVLAVNTRKMFNPALPVGFYGNTTASPVARSTAGKLSQSPLSYAVELIKRAKESVTEEFMRSTIDVLVQSGRPQFATVRTYRISDVSKAGIEKVDFGWGEAVYGGMIGGSSPTSFFVSSGSNNGEPGILGLIDLPGEVMKRFVLEIQKLIKPSSSL